MVGLEKVVITIRPDDSNASGGANLMCIGHQIRGFPYSQVSVKLLTFPEQYVWSTNLNEQLILENVVVSFCVMAAHLVSFLHVSPTLRVLLV